MMASFASRWLTSASTLPVSIQVPSPENQETWPRKPPPTAGRGHSVAGLPRTPLPAWDHPVLQRLHCLSQPVEGLQRKGFIKGRHGRGLSNPRNPAVNSCDGTLEAAVAIVGVGVAVLVEVNAVIHPVVKNYHVRGAGAFHQELLQVLDFQHGIEGVLPKVGDCRGWPSRPVEPLGQKTGYRLVIGDSFAAGRGSPQHPDMFGFSPSRPAGLWAVGCTPLRLRNSA